MDGITFNFGCVGMALPLALTSIGASLSSLSLRRLMRPSHLFHPTSPLPALASLFWAAPLPPPPPPPPPDFCEEVFRSWLVKVRVSLGALRDMGDSQLETSLLRSCLALPKVSFVLRTCPPPQSHSYVTLLWILTLPSANPLSPLWAGLYRTGRG